MAASIAASIARIKRDALGAVGRGAVEQVCDELGHAWRERELDPATTGRAVRAAGPSRQRRVQ